MFYDFSLTIPANTLESAPLERDLQLAPGIIFRVSLLFPPGPHGMVKVKLRRGLHQVWPTDPEGYFASDDEVVDFDEHYPMDDMPYLLTFVGYSPGTTYDHTIAVRVGILATETVSPFQGLGAGLRRLLQFVGIGS